MASEKMKAAFETLKLREGSLSKQLGKERHAADEARSTAKDHEQCEYKIETLKRTINEMRIQL